MTDYDYNYMLQHFKYGTKIVQTTKTYNEEVRFGWRSKIEYMQLRLLCNYEFACIKAGVVGKISYVNDLSMSLNCLLNP